MWTRFGVAAHLSADELLARYRAAHDLVARSRGQMVWLLVSGRPLAEVAAVTGYSPRWIREVVRHYNEEGADALADRRHENAGAAPLLDEAGRQALDEALLEPPPEGGRWTGPKVAAWIARRLARARVAPQRGRDYLRRTGHSLQVPRPRHTEAADAAARAASRRFTETAGGRRFSEAPRAFQKTSTR
jgi:transposase